MNAAQKKAINDAVGIAEDDIARCNIQLQSNPSDKDLKARITRGYKEIADLRESQAKDGK